MSRALLGLIKGILVGGAVGYGLFVLGSPRGFWVTLACGVVGLLVGLICGRAPWRADTIWTPVLKMFVGLLIGGGAGYLGHRFLQGALDISQLVHHDLKLAFNSGPLLAPAVGVLYGIFVEIDDGASGKNERRPKGLS